MHMGTLGKNWLWLAGWQQLLLVLVLLAWLLLLLVVLLGLLPEAASC
jgi:hypothetical protein